MPLSTPVAFLVFNRPEQTRQVFERIRQAKPPVLLVVADGPRNAEEEDACKSVRSIINEVDWDCQVLQNYSDENMGCRNRVSSGISWVFDQVDEAIILEDDCLPAPSFFSFCEILLEKYRHDSRIMHISGNNFQNGQSRSSYGYYFSRYSHIWGWASWKRAWKYYDVNMSTWSEFQKQEGLKSVFEIPDEQSFWAYGFEESYHQRIRSWDYQWFYTCLSQGGLAILPDVNLVTNIGFGAQSTHTDQQSPMGNLPLENLETISHPPFIYRHAQADAYTYYSIYDPQHPTKVKPKAQPPRRSLRRRLLDRLSPIKGRG